VKITRCGRGNLDLLPSPLWGGVGGGGGSWSVIMSARDPRIWAKRDRNNVSPQHSLARRMRSAPTQAERKLWWHLRHRLGMTGTHFRRQVRIDRYIVDFACHAQRLIVEVDGGQHATQLAADAERTKILTANDYRVLRYWNNDILRNIDGVLEDIHRVITATPTPSPSPPQVGLARLAHYDAQPGRARVAWGGEQTARDRPC
jgi:very-short-patch-repair endonuclease